jgi:hypothetical protein
MPFNWHALCSVCRVPTQSEFGPQLSDCLHIAAQRQTMFNDPMTALQFAGTPASRPPPYLVKTSHIHGRGAFATRKIAAGALIDEYEGERISASRAAKRHGKNRNDPHHTFFFSLESGRVIDGASGGNDSRWINHACEPNCKAVEEDGRIFIYALRDIGRGEELSYDYALIVAERHTPALKRAYACRCGTGSCRQTMLAPKRKITKKAQKKS